MVIRKNLRPWAKAEKNIENQQKQYAALPEEIEKAKAAAEKMKQDLPRLVEEAAAAEAAYRKAQETTWKAMDALGADDLLAGKPGWVATGTWVPAASIRR